MKAEKGKLELHVFVCTNKKDPGKECCADRNGARLRDELKELAASEVASGRRIRINASGCLGQCENGIAVAIYPKGEWLLGCRADDAHRVWEHLKKN